MPNEKCPLCKQPVSDELFDKITGIWKAREAQEKELAQKKKVFLEEQKKSRQQWAIDKKKLIAEQKAQFAEKVKASTEKYEARIKGFELEKKKIQVKADKKILLAVKNAERIAKAQVKVQMKAQMEKSVASQVKKATTKLVEDKKKTDNTLAATLKQMSTLQTNSAIQQKKISSLERQLKNKSTPQLEGLLYEDTLMEALQKEFPNDKFKNTGKGGDILQDIIYHNEPSGIIIYECKKVSHWSGAHVEQTATAKIQRHADFGILVTNAQKKGTSGFFLEKGVIVVDPGGVLALATILREQLVKMSQLKLSKAEREKAISDTFEYLQGPEFKNSLDVIIRKAIELNEDLKKEHDDHIKMWIKRQETLKVVYLNASKVKTTTFSLMSGKEKAHEIELETKPFPLLTELKEND